MKDQALRMTNKDHAPSAEELQGWLGPQAYTLWERFSNFVDAAYPGIFVPEWIYGGKKHGWSLRYKKSKSFCTMVPETERFALLIVFGAEERAKTEDILPQLSERTSSTYDEAATYHDGKWVLFSIDDEAAFSDVKTLLAVKRKPKAGVKISRDDMLKTPL